MKKEKRENGYELIADEGKELIILKRGKELARAKTVHVPTEGTKNTWVEVDEIIPDPIPEPTAEEIKQRRIEELEEELTRLRA